MTNAFPKITHEDPEPWGEPEPIAQVAAPLPSTAVMGDTLGPVVEAYAHALQVPPAMVLNAALPLVSTAAQGKWWVNAGPSWSEPVGLASVTVANPGERKSAVVNALKRPLAVYERELRDAEAANVAEASARYELAKDRMEGARKAAKEGDLAAEEEYVDAARKLAEMAVPALPQLVLDDCTPEAMVAALAAQGGSIGIVSTEPTLLSNLAGRYSGGNPSTENFLKATSGDPIIVNRMSRGTLTVDDPCLSVVTCIQPGLIADLSQKPGFRESGLLARFLWSVPDPMVGMHEISPGGIPDDVADLWARKLTTLATVARSRPGRTYMTLTDGAEKVFTEFRTALEPMLHPGHGRLAPVADWASKLPGATARIAAALTLLEDPENDRIGEHVMDCAVVLAKWYCRHALKAFGAIHSTDGSQDHASQVLQWLVHKGARVVTVREVHKSLSGRQWVKSAAEIKAALALLAEHGHIRLDTEPSGKSQRYEMHPAYLVPDVEHGGAAA